MAGGKRHYSGLILVDETSIIYIVVIPTIFNRQTSNRPILDMLIMILAMNEF